MSNTRVSTVVDFKLASGYDMSDWKNRYGYIFEEYEIRFENKQKDNISDILTLIEEFSEEFWCMRDVNGQVIVDLTCNSADNLFTDVDVRKRVDEQQNKVSNIISKYGISNCELRCILYYNTYAISFDRE